MEKTEIKVWDVVYWLDRDSNKVQGIVNAIKDGSVRVSSLGPDRAEYWLPMERVCRTSKELDEAFESKAASYARRITTVEDFARELFTRYKRTILKEDTVVAKALATKAEEFGVNVPVMTEADFEDMYYARDTLCAYCRRCNCNECGVTELIAETLKDVKIPDDPYYDE